MGNDRLTFDADKTGTNGTFAPETIPIKAEPKSI